MSFYTNYKDPSGNDLASIFSLLKDPSGGIGYNIGYQDINGVDFSQLFMPLGTKIPLSYDTNYKDMSGNDLNKIFAPKAIDPVYDVSGIYELISGSSPFIIKFSPSNGSITFYDNIKINVIVIGAGGGGGGGSNRQAGSPNIAAGGGGGGGAIGLLENFIISANTQYGIVVGTGGFPGGGNNGGGPGGNSYFYNFTQEGNNPTSFYIEATGGGGGGGHFQGSQSGYAGEVSTDYNNLDIISYDSASGGRGYNQNGNFDAQNGSSISPSLSNNPIILPNGNTVVGSGGGGGGTFNTSTYPQYRGGTSGSNGNGGLAGGNNSVNGQNASSNGSGGGGGGAPQSSGQAANGSTGADGVVYIYFEYP